MLVRNLIFLLFSPFVLLGQTNGSFEEPQTTWPNNIFPNNLSQIELATPWKAAIDIPADGSGPHTPDWISTCSPNHMSILEQIASGSNVFEVIQANTGCKYASMLPGELIQQDISNSLGENTTSVRVELYIRLPHTWYYSNDSGFQRTPLATTGMQLIFFMSKDKIEYKNPSDICSAADDNGYKKKGDPVVVAVQNLSIEEYPQGSWHRIVADFPAPSKDHNWLGFEFKVPSGVVCNREVLLIDDIDINVTPCGTCSNCTPYDGCIEHTLINVSHGPNVPFTIGGLSNVDYFKLEIFENDQQNGALRTIEIPSNCPQMVSWDGKNDSGTEVSGINLEINLELRNTCETIKLKNVPISKLFTELTTFNPNTMVYVPVLKQDLRDACCYDPLVMSANNIAYLNPPTNIAMAEILYTSTPFITEDLVVIAPGDITFEEGVHIYVNPDVNVTLQAGGQCLLQQNVHISLTNGGSFVCSSNVECMPGFVGDPPSNLVVNGNTLTDIYAKKESETNIDSTANYIKRADLREANIIENRIEIYPNPSFDGIFNLEIIGNYDGDIVLNVHDTKGLKIFHANLLQNMEQHLIDISGFANGLYYVTISTQEDRQVRKIIKQ